MPANTSNLGGVTVLSTLSLYDGLSVGGTAPITKSLVTTVSVVAITATATKSTTTTATVSGLSTVDTVQLTPTGGSGMSAGVVVQGYCSAADTLTVVYSNVSTANAAQIATVFKLVSFR